MLLGTTLFFYCLSAPVLWWKWYYRCNKYMKYLMSLLFIVWTPLTSHQRHFNQFGKNYFMMNASWRDPSIIIEGFKRGTISLHQIFTFFSFRIFGLPKSTEKKSKHRFKTLLAISFIPTEQTEEHLLQASRSRFQPSQPNMNTLNMVQI